MYVDLYVDCCGYVKNLTNTQQKKAGLAGGPSLSSFTRVKGLENNRMAQPNRSHEGRANFQAKAKISILCSCQLFCPDIEN